MSNSVAARRLRKSMLANVDMDKNLDSIESLSNIKLTSKTRESIARNEYTGALDKDEKKISYFKLKLLIKSFIAVTIVFVALSCKLMFKEEAKNNKYIKPIIVNYNKDYSKEDIINKVEILSKIVYKNFKFLIPDKIKEYTVSKYNSIIKPKYMSFSLKNEINEFIYKYKSSVEGKPITADSEKEIQNVENVQKQNEIKVVEEEKKTEKVQKVSESDTKLGVGGGNEVVQKTEESSISTQSSDVEQILAKKISIIQPVYGVITSNYGARDEIFEGVNSYHTGIDIANTLGTPIKSATTGKVIKAELGNKYYGNNVEIETDGVIFRYAHLNSISVKLNQNVNQSDIIGKMGSTGMSTGSHLHFEIKINSNTVDPREILEFK